MAGPPLVGEDHRIVDVQGILVVALDELDPVGLRCDAQTGEAVHDL